MRGCSCKCSPWLQDAPAHSESGPHRMAGTESSPEHASFVHRRIARTWSILLTLQSPCSYLWPSSDLSVECNISQEVLVGICSQVCSTVMHGTPVHFCERSSLLWALQSFQDTDCLLCNHHALRRLLPCLHSAEQDSRQQQHGHLVKMSHHSTWANQPAGSTYR